MHMLEVHIGIASMRQFHFVTTIYLTENKENYFWNLHLGSIMSISIASFKHLNLPIRIKITVTIPQSIYICMIAISQHLIS